MRSMGSVPPSDLAGVFAIVELVNNLVRDPGIVNEVIDPIRTAHDELAAMRDASTGRLREAEDAERRAIAASERAAKEVADAAVRVGIAESADLAMRERLAGIEAREAEVARAAEALDERSKAVSRQARDADQEHNARLSALAAKEGAVGQLQESLEARLAEVAALKAEYQTKLNTIKALAGAEVKE